MAQISKSKMAVMVVVLGSTGPAQIPPNLQLLSLVCAKPVPSWATGSTSDQVEMGASVKYQVPTA